jgi:hypothetical protein
MQIQMNTDGNIEGHEALATQVSSDVANCKRKGSADVRTLA